MYIIPISIPSPGPRQGDSSAGHIEGQIVDIDCGSLGFLSRDMRGGVDNNNNIPSGFSRSS